MTQMQQAFADAERKQPIPNIQRVWNVIQSKPWCTQKYIRERLRDMPEGSVTSSVYNLLDRCMIDVRDGARGPMGPTPKEFKVNSPTFVLLPASEKMKESKKAKPAAPAPVPATLPGVAVFNKAPPGNSLLDQVKAAPFAEVMAIYTYLKDTFK